ncbi:MAG: TrmH family RNA methyltransferase [Oscillospiraceae bacterium]|nr:TrmH family RNA methyltransferase [Oscillospiraceae bacterium]
MNKSNGIVMPYKKEHGISYTFGAYTTIELLNTRPDAMRAVYIHSQYTAKEVLEKLCGEKHIPVLFSDRAFERLNQKENSYVLGVFSKYTCRLHLGAPHVVLVNPGDMGNLGTILRTLAAMNIRDLGLITPAADILHPKTVRASIGALFHIQFAHFASFDDYRRQFDRPLYLFMLNGEAVLSGSFRPPTGPYTLVFGNEATGLPDAFARYGTSVRIAQSPLVDSLNLSVAVGIGTFLFAAGDLGE